MKPTSSKHFCCTICQRGFTRIDHLKRHHLRHSGIKPYSCIFCKESFARCDNLRDHYNDCAQRGDRKIPETGQRGRRRHACQSCTSMKLRCDGLSPCGSCQKRGLECNNERKKQTQDSSPGADAPTTPDDLVPPSDRGSIKFLLNGGTDSFTEEFLLPPRSDRTRGLEYHNQLEEAEQSRLAYPVKDESGYGPAFVDSDPSTLSFFHDTFLDFFNGPFGAPQKPVSDPFNGMVYPTIIPPADDPNFAFAGEPIYEPERPFATAMIQAILARAWSVPLDPKAHEEISINLNYLLTTARIRKFVAMYFKYWQPNCPILHYPSFNPDTISLPLLVSVTFLGAMYSRDQRESYAAKRLIDFAELYVFSSEVFAPEHEIGLAYSGVRHGEYDFNHYQFQNLQAGFIMCVAQYWSGSPMSRSRVMEARFSEVIRVARHMGLPKCRHQPDASVDEQTWIQKECRIRTMNIISLLDCAFSFYQNFPCRLSHTEMECDFPCPESVFASEHPFGEPKFRFAREYTISEAFQSLFEEPGSRDTPSSESVSPAPEILPSVTVFDMFILIHLLYAFINEHMTLQIPLLRLTRAAQSNPKSSGRTRPRTAGVAEDSTLASIRTALSRWREHWQTLRMTVTTNEWAAMGFYRNGYNFWLVSHLLITKKESVDVIMQMEVNCEDKLERLKVLLQDDTD
ncbi:fungal-specific transcription factor domain-containing protein [Aspergillus floccosus]